MKKNQEPDGNERKTISRYCPFKGEIKNALSSTLVYGRVGRRWISLAVQRVPFPLINSPVI
jgi:hypothetical protein